ncbi:chemosensory receptor c [Plakobranchus ocellatus]|uniref:Chemosensory receptor c n=1 Tax=Plakobranchus ocellatus TaxID=259542 RepID=A0AAV3XWD4_9GAST|nr:chemosensory receptor c [Plakobranchus ocellatus]
MATNSSEGVNIHVAFAGQILSRELFPYLTSLFCIFALIFSVPAVCFNAINIFIFCKIGGTDSITVCFLHLALCDFCTMVFQSIGSLFKLLFSLNVPGCRNLSTYTFATAVTYSLFLDVASATTTYIALQRGLCVAWPFLTRHVFTRNRSLTVLVIITLILLGGGMPRALTFRFRQLPGPTNNSSPIVIVQFLGIHGHFDAFYLIFVKIIMGFTQYITMAVCAVAIFIGMRSSIKLKSVSSSAGSDSNNKKSKPGSLGNPETTENRVKPPTQKKIGMNSEDAPTEAKQEKGKKVPQKELLVIKQALTVVLLQVFCTTPGIIVFIYSMFEPRFELGTEFHNVFYVVFSGIDMCYAANAFANFFIYLHFNSKFKYCFHSVFQFQKRSGNENINLSSAK